MEYKITARWFKVSLTGAPSVYDLAEINNELYVAVKPNSTNENLESYWTSVGGPAGASSIEEVYNQGLHDLAHIIKNRKPDWILEIQEIKCECGAEKCKTTHSIWCPKFLTNY